jgi:hypothetical protein
MSTRVAAVGYIMLYDVDVRAVLLYYRSLARGYYYYYFLVGYIITTSYNIITTN